MNDNLRQIFYDQSSQGSKLSKVTKSKNKLSGNQSGPSFGSTRTPKHQKQKGESIKSTDVINEDLAVAEEETKKRNQRSRKSRSLSISEIDPKF